MGPQIMLRREHQNTQIIADYESRLVAVKDQCVMCRLRGLEGGPNITSVAVLSHTNGTTFMRTRV